MADPPSDTGSGDGSKTGLGPKKKPVKPAEPGSEQDATAGGDTSPNDDTKTGLGVKKR